jgi:hypothetical protein
MLDMELKTKTNIDSLRQQMAHERARWANPGAFATMNSVTRPRQPIEEEPFVSAEDIRTDLPDLNISATDTRPRLEAVPDEPQQLDPLVTEAASAPKVSETESSKAA